MSFVRKIPPLCDVQVVSLGIEGDRWRPQWAEVFIDDVRQEDVGESQEKFFSCSERFRTLRMEFYHSHPRAGVRQSLWALRGLDVSFLATGQDGSRWHIRRAFVATEDRGTGDFSDPDHSFDISFRRKLIEAPESMRSVLHQD